MLFVWELEPEKASDRRRLPGFRFLQCLCGDGQTRLDFESLGVLVWRRSWHFSGHPELQILGGIHGECHRGM
uniref:Uncharacterized protein n=1 Tax=Rhizophora mucronata TaxID=61149 RepID=A0A2P2Q516_RHIMU